MNKPINLFQIISFSSVHSGMSRSGFSIVLHKDFANALLKIERNQGEQITETMMNILSETLGKFNCDPYSVRYVENTWLLQSLHIGGNCACFSVGYIDESDKSRHIRYNPHNIDSPLQAACLLSMWLFWFNTVSVLTEFELPFVI